MIIDLNAQNKMASTEVTQLNNILRDYKLKAECLTHSAHKHFHFYNLKLTAGERISRIENFAPELGLALKSKSKPIFSTLSEQGLIRLQTTHGDAEEISLHEMLVEYLPPANMFFPFLLGETEEGLPYWMDMVDNPHLLVAGASGSGKSVLLHNLIGNALYRNDVEIFLSDCKQVEFNAYKDLGNVQLATTYQETVKMLEYVFKMMNGRYDILKNLKITSVEQKPKLFTKIIVILDEIGDLILSDKSKDLQNFLIRLAQKARAAGIYLVMATQRPSVNIISGLIKANFPARICCKVSSRTDSMVVLDQPGGESLLGKGDALVRSPKYGMSRLQIAFSDSFHNMLSVKDI